ncbi:MAG: LamG domain-containing protein [Fibrobacterales bacterium]
MYQVVAIQHVIKMMGIISFSLMVVCCGDTDAVLIAEVDEVESIETHPDIENLTITLNEIELLTDTLILIGQALSKETDPSRHAVFESALGERVEKLNVEIIQFQSTVDSLELYNTEALSLVSTQSDSVLVAEYTLLKELLENFKTEELTSVAAFQSIANQFAQNDAVQSSAMQTPVGDRSSNVPSDVLSTMSSHAWSLAASSLEEVSLSSQTSIFSSSIIVDTTSTELSSVTDLLSSATLVSSTITVDTVVGVSSSIVESSSGEESSIVSVSSVALSSSAVVLVSSSSVSISSSSSMVALSSSSVSLSSIESSSVELSSQELSSSQSSSSVFVDETEVINIYASSYVRLPHFNDDWESQGMTIEAWVIWDTFEDHAPIVHLSNGMHKFTVVLGLGVKSGNNNPLKFNVLNANSGTSAGDWSGTSLDSAFVKGQWTHVAVSVSTLGTVSMYINGILRKSVDVGSKVVPESVDRYVNYIGKSAVYSDGHFDGRVDNVRIWNRVRTAAEIEAHLYSVTEQLDYNSDLIVSYDFDYVANDVFRVEDRSGNQKDGKLEGASGDYGPTGSWREQINFNALEL